MAKPTDLEKRLGITFKNRELLQNALVHSSYVNENPEVAPESNERLEFLGDAVLGLIIADELFDTFPGHAEGPLTELRAHLVRRDTLAHAAERMRLGEALLLGRGEEEGGGRSRPTNLSHIYEAVVGAGAVVLRDVPDHGLVVGNPGRLAGWMCTCGERIAFDDDGATGRCEGCDRRYEKSGTEVTALSADQS